VAQNRNKSLNVWRENHYVIHTKEHISGRIYCELFNENGIEFDEEYF
jgi:hypothetical protein